MVKLADLRLAVDEENEQKIFNVGQALRKDPKAFKKFPADVQDEISVATFRAAAFLGKADLAQAIFGELVGRHPTSKKLTQLGLRGLDNITDVVKIVAERASDPNNTDLADRKALLAHIKDHGNVEMFATMMESYISDFPADRGAWREALSLFTRTGKLPKAKTAAEELSLVLDPENAFFLLTLADLFFTNGEFFPASKYFCLAVLFQPWMPRALWGLITTYSSMKAVGGYEERLNEIGPLTLQCTKRLIEVYERESAVAGTVGKEHKQKDTDMVLTDDEERRVLFLESVGELCQRISEEIEGEQVPDFVA